jgi:hypothetical protein
VEFPAPHLAVASALHLVPKQRVPTSARGSATTKGANMPQDKPTGATKQPRKDPNASLKPGSSADDARKVGGKGDFGAPEGGLTGRTAERDYTSRNTKVSDPGAPSPYDFEHDGVRDHGAGGRDTGPGSASGGDIDPDVVGVGTGGSGIATSGVTGRPPGPDDSDGSSDEFASGAHAHGRNQTLTGNKVGGSKRVAGGSTVSRDTDTSTGGGAQGAAAVTNPIHEAGGDVKHTPNDAYGDSFASEISLGEASGEDAGMLPSSDTQDTDDDNRA